MIYIAPSAVRTSTVRAPVLFAPQCCLRSSAVRTDTPWRSGITIPVDDVLQREEKDWLPQHDNFRITDWENVAIWFSGLFPGAITTKELQYQLSLLHNSAKRVVPNKQRTINKHSCLDCGTKVQL